MANDNKITDLEGIVVKGEKENITGALSLQKWLLGRTSDNAENAFHISAELADYSQPKTTFLFTAEFVFSDGESYGSESMYNLEVDLLSATRPTITFTNENINFYNYRSKVTTKVEFGQVTITMYEDSLDKSNGIIKKYLESISPISRLALSGRVADTLNNVEYIGIDTSSETPKIPKQDKPSISVFSGVGPLKDGEESGLLKSLILYHHFIELDSVGKITKRKVTKYVCMNPKVNNFSFNNLDYSNSAVSTITIVFDIDSVSIETIDLPDDDNIDSSSGAGSQIVPKNIGPFL